MYGHYYDSYYEHGCSILHEKDVLTSGIRGNGGLTILKRWWYNLFLLSYSNKQCRNYYHSSYAMRIDRLRHFRHYRNCIHPLSKFKKLWDCFILHVILINKFLFYCTSSPVTADLPLFFNFMGIGLEIIVLFDIYLNTKFGYIDKITRNIVLDLDKVFKRYCSKNLFFHVAAAIPVHCIMFLRYGMEVSCTHLCKTNKFICTLIVVNTFSLLRIVEVSRYWTEPRKTYAATCFFRFLRICMLALSTISHFDLLSDAMSLLSYMQQGYVYPKSYYGLVFFVKYHVDDIGALKIFAYDIRRLFKSLLFNNYSKMYNNTLTFIIEYLISAGFYFWGIIEVLSCISRGKFSSDQVNNNKASSIRLAKSLRLPDKICLKMDKYYNFNMSKLILVEKRNTYYMSLPLVLKKEINMYSYGRLLTRIPYFSHWPTKIIEGFVLLLKEEIFLESDMVAEAGIQGDGLFILEVGMLAVYTAERKEQGHLIDGDYFGELSLVTDKEIRTSCIVAIADCKVLILEKREFRMFMRDYPDQFFELKQQLKSRYSQVISRSAVNSPNTVPGTKGISP